MSDRRKQIKTLLNAERYSTMNSWNGVKSISRNVKLYNLGLTEKQEAKANEVLFDDVSNNIIDYLIEKYSALLLDKTDNNYILGKNGRNGGYIVMYKLNNDNRILLGEGFLDNYYCEEDFEYLTDSEIEEQYNILKSFNEVVNEMIEEFKYILDNYEIEEKEEIITKKVKTLFVY